MTIREPLRKTKIVCTIGVATGSHEMLDQLIVHGMDIARLNFAHGSHEEHAQYIQTIRQQATSRDKPIACLQDLPGPKLRIGRIKDEPVKLNEGAQFVLTTREGEVVGNESIATVNYRGLPEDVNPGEPIYLDDGLIELKVIHIDGVDIRCEVVHGGELSSYKGLNLPKTPIKLPAITPDDVRHLKFGLKMGVDIVGLSFVRKAADISEARELIRKEAESKYVPIIAKIERYEALTKIDDIIEAADGIMVARGDLGIETPLEEVPLAQKEIISKCNLTGKPVITATQMLESMIENPRPTRAEVSDVANAIFDGTDAVMLSEETACGKYPIEALQAMVRIALRAEAALDYNSHEKRFKLAQAKSGIADAISYASVEAAEDLNAAAIVTPTRSGSTARLIARYRPRVPIIAVTPYEETRRSLALSWGVYPLVLAELTNTDEMLTRSLEKAKASGLVNSGDVVIITAGAPTGAPGTTNLLKVQVVD